ncbi:hypothetical protein AAVH_27673, partial [Aphelenchoides avenae]
MTYASTTVNGVLCGDHATNEDDCTFNPVDYSDGTPAKAKPSKVKFVRFPLYRDKKRM